MCVCPCVNVCVCVCSSFFPAFYCVLLFILLQFSVSALSLPWTAFYFILISNMFFQERKCTELPVGCPLITGYLLPFSFSFRATVTIELVQRSAQLQLQQRLRLRLVFPFDFLSFSAFRKSQQRKILCE